MSVYLKEFFGEFHVAVMSILVLIGIAFIVPGMDRWVVWVAVAIGMISYTVSEYLTHRFFFHMKPPSHPLMLKFLKRIHYDHHVDPRDLKLLFLPIWYSLPQIIIFGLIVLSIFHDVTIAAAYTVGIASFLLYYEWTHYIAHKEIIPKTPWGKYMKKMHLWHHYKNENYWYGVTNPVYDRLLGTFRNQNQVEKSETARNLEK